MLSDTMMLGGGRKVAYPIENSLLFHGGQYLTRTFGSPTNQDKWTLSFWLRRSALGTVQTILSSNYGNGGDELLWFDANDKLSFGAQNNNILVTSQVFRDVGSWYHFKLDWDAANATSFQRARLWVNGVEVTSFYTDARSLVAQGFGFWNTARGFTLGNRYAQSMYFSGYLAEFVFVDGANPAISSFGEFDPVTHSWHPRPVSGLNFGSNGFYLGKPWNSASLGADSSGKGNNWTPSGFVGTDVLNDSPTNVYATLNPLSGNIGSGAQMSAGNLTFGGSLTNGHGSISELVSGKWYWEVKVDAQYYQYPDVGVWSSAAGARRFGNVGTGNANGAGFLAIEAGNYTSVGLQYGETSYQNTTAAPWNTVFAVGDVVGIALDLTSNKLWFSKNGVWLQGNPSTGTSPAVTLSAPAYSYTPAAFNYASSTVTFNFGQRAWAYTPPAGFSALCTANLPTPSAAAKQPWKYYSCQTVVHNGTSSTVTLGWNPDSANGGSHSLFRIKSLSAGSWYWIDTVRGLAKYLNSDSSAIEGTNANLVTSALSTGVVTLGNGFAAGTYLVEAWRVAPEAGFDIVSYTGTGVAGSISHNLGTAPKMIVTKQRGPSPSNWGVWFSGFAYSEYLYMDSSSAKVGSWNWLSAVDGTKIAWGTNGYAWAVTNQAGSAFVAYVWSEVPGFSKFGSYVGNGTTDGPFVYTGFPTASTLFKAVTATGGTDNWVVMDSTRDPHNQCSKGLLLNSSSAEIASSNYYLDIDVAGLKVHQDTGYGINNGVTYVTATFASRSLGGNKTTPATAR